MRKRMRERWRVCERENETNNTSKDDTETSYKDQNKIHAHRKRQWQREVKKEEGRREFMGSHHL